MQRRWGVVIGLIVAGIAVVPLATAGAQAPPTTADQTIEGSAPPGGNVNCETAPTLDPDHGEPGTEVTATADFTDNCDDALAFFFADMTCFGTVSGGGLEEPIQFPVTVNFVSENFITVSGTFTAPAVEPDPPVVDAIEDLAVTITCNEPGTNPTVQEGAGTTYFYPPANYALELFSNPDDDQPTFVDDDDDTPGTVDPGVVTATPTFTG